MDVAKYDPSAICSQSRKNCCSRLAAVVAILCCFFIYVQPAVVELLLLHGVDPDAKTRDGETIIGKFFFIYLIHEFDK